MSARPVTPVLPARHPARAGAAARWADIVTPAGRYDRRVIARIAHATARAERNLEILVAAGIATPRALPLADTRAWQAAAAARIDVAGRNLLPYRTRYARALADVWGYARAKRGNLPAADKPNKQIVAALRAARRFITQPARVTHEGALARAEYLIAGASYNELNAQLCAALRALGEAP
jgi:hypothetical protein